MLRWKPVVFGLVMLTVGYVAGRFELMTPRTVRAQARANGELSETAENKIREIHAALEEAKEILRQEGRYTPVTDEINAFLILSGGGNAVEDLQEGNGVDPETFAALYAGRAMPEIADQLGVDAEGRITYNDKPIQMYSRRRLARTFAERARIREIRF